MTRFWLLIFVVYSLIVPTSYAGGIDDQSFTNVELLNMCKSGFFTEREKLKKITDILVTEKHSVDSYFATKWLSQFGMGYLLLVNYSNNSILLSVSNIGIYVRQLNRPEGDRILKDLLVDGYETVKDDLSDESFHPSCTFYNFFDSNNMFEFELLNSTGQEGSAGELIHSKASALIDQEMKYHNKANDDLQLFSHQPENYTYSEEEFFKFRDTIKKDLFIELSIIKKGLCTPTKSKSRR
ncbi:MAG: hypothetical protein R3E90_09250 [Marinicella sp.]